MDSDFQMKVHNYLTQEGVLPDDPQSGEEFIEHVALELEAYWDDVLSLDIPKEDWDAYRDSFLDR